MREKVVKKIVNFFLFKYHFSLKTRKNT